MCGLHLTVALSRADSGQMTLTTAYALDASTEGKVKILKVFPAGELPRPVRLSHTPLSLLYLNAGNLEDARNWKTSRRKLDHTLATTAIVVPDEE